MSSWSVQAGGGDVSGSRVRSESGCCGVLGGSVHVFVIDGMWRPIAYCSQSLTEAE